MACQALDIAKCKPFLAGFWHYQTLSSFTLRYLLNSCLVQVELYAFRFKMNFSIIRTKEWLSEHKLERGQAKLCSRDRYDCIMSFPSYCKITWVLRWLCAINLCNLTSSEQRSNTGRDSASVPPSVCSSGRRSISIRQSTKREDCSTNYAGNRHCFLSRQIGLVIDLRYRTHCRIHHTDRKTTSFADRSCGRTGQS